MRHLVAVVVAAGVALAAGGARAQPADVEAILRRGVELRAQRQDEAALREFARAWALDRSPRARAQMGWAEQALGRWVDAEAHLTEALSARDDPWVRENADALARSLADVANHLGSVEVLTNVPGAEVEVDGRPVGRAPLAAPLRVAAGTVTVRVFAPGHTTVLRENVRVRAGGLARETVELAPLPVPTTTTAAAPPGAPPRRRDAPAPEDRGDARGTIGWVLIAGGGLAGGAAVASWFAAGSAADDYAAGVRGGRCAGGDVPAEREPPGECQDLRAAVGRYDALAVAGVVASGALLVAGVVLVATAPPRARRVAWSCGAGPGTLGMACAFGF